jgi:hypothetical protein
MINDDMVERVARAIAFEMATLSEYESDFALSHMARAAIAAMRNALEPVGWETVAWAPFHEKKGWDIGAVSRSRSDVEAFLEPAGRDWIARPLYTLSLSE